MRWLDARRHLLQYVVVGIGFTASTGTGYGQLVRKVK